MHIIFDNKFIILCLRILFLCSFISKNSNFFKKEYKAHKKIQSSVLFISFISILFPYTFPIVYPPLLDLCNDI